MLTTKQQADLIKARITMSDVLQAYGFNGGAPRGRIPCPIHGGEHKNFSFNDFGFKCFVCGAHGGVVSFVEQFLESSFEYALNDINRRFHLWNDDEEETATLSYSAIRKRKKKISDANNKRLVVKRREAAYLAARLELNRLDANLIRYAPKHFGDALDERYIEACQKIETVVYMLESMERR